MSRVRQLVLGACALTLASLLSGCGLLEPEREPVAPSANWETVIPGSESARQAEAFPQVYAQEVQWYECTEAEGYDSERAELLESMGYDPEWVACGIAEAPMDWNDPENTETIELSFSWLPALSDEPKLGTLFTNPGGPGSPGTDFGFDTALSENFEPVADRYDIVGVDPRGVGTSTPIDCDVAYPGDPAEGLRECVENNPLTHTMGTNQVARDFELLRHLLEDSKLNYYGVSYGTMLGGTYASLFPERVGRMVLDSAEDADWASLEHGFEQQVAISEATLELANRCVTEFAGDRVEVCPFTDEQSLVEVVERLQSEPLVSREGATLNGTDFAWAISGYLYEDAEAQAEGLELVALALFGDQDAIDELVEYGGGSATDLVMKTIACHSAPPSDVEALRSYIASRGVPGLWAGAEVTEEDVLQFADTSCEVLPERGGDYIDAYTAEGIPPVLVLGVTGDHATPYAFGQQFARELGNATFVTLDGPGHGASYMSRSTCVDDVVTSYLLRGDLPRDGLVCRDDSDQ